MTPKKNLNFEEARNAIFNAARRPITNHFESRSLFSSSEQRGVYDNIWDATVLIKELYILYYVNVDSIWVSVLIRQDGSSGPVLTCGVCLLLQYLQPVQKWIQVRESILIASRMRCRICESAVSSRNNVEIVSLFLSCDNSVGQTHQSVSGFRLR